LRSQKPQEKWIQHDSTNKCQCHRVDGDTRWLGWLAVAGKFSKNSPRADQLRTEDKVEQPTPKPTDTIETRLGKNEAEADTSARNAAPISLTRWPTFAPARRADGAFESRELPSGNVTLEIILKVWNGQMALILSFAEKLGIVWSNFDMPYFVGFADLEKSSPLFFELPKGLSSFCPKMAL
jgi:hypothetical protein